MLSDKINSLPISQTVAMTAKAHDLKNQGVDVITLSAGEPDFNVPDYIKDAAIDAINENYHKYSPVDGFLDLKKAICKKFKRDNNLDYNTDQIVVSTGAKQSIANVCMSLINKGDEVVIPTPYWVSYSAMVSLADGIPVFVNPDENANFKVTAKQIESAITDKTKMIMLNSPNNPSGSVFSEQEYLEFSKVLLKYPKIIIVSDEIYEHINYGSKSVSFASLPGMYERTVTVNGISKAFAMTGWRIGYLAAPKVLAKACNKMQGQITSGANCIAQRATIKALEESPEKIKYMVDEFKIRRDLIINLVNQINGFEVKRPPDGAFYIFPEVSDLFGKTFKGQTVNDANDLSMLILEKAHVATVPGDAFGYPDCIRISYSTSREQIEEAIRRIKDLLS
ncbi:MAG: pyridoxal phosphate-dependent aminotransferase [Candidatus Marisimplicoccus sp.]|jgi:aspartate aminotransferase|nr:pyridoxal phosphate-dependent aminotransferase [Flavobacteriaceae bacterium]MDA9883641.1 pyridoxal phosphate-dependent aminotransferase [Flavobacteriaceae bacterium]MDB0024868.1 pyridoxal phosphate-dependent aminotransferase [bacterium]MDC1009730.1 pyridoxal phosphate-dependent aminotransferase [Flavobacteriaceae bacterium]MDC3297329.1 pyridoxal phosphate-dependent aminotransferase [Flavobacteriaceae bacterium]|tara:strand:- start:631 stop:1812 length:1182 start_codon:yes stop_codon:yes gene_type:complete